MALQYDVVTFTPAGFSSKLMKQRRETLK